MAGTAAAIQLLKGRPGAGTFSRRSRPGKRAATATLLNDGRVTSLRGHRGEIGVTLAGRGRNQVDGTMSLRLSELPRGEQGPEVEDALRPEKPLNLDRELVHFGLQFVVEQLPLELLDLPLQPRCDFADRANEEVLSHPRLQGKP